MRSAPPGSAAITANELPPVPHYCRRQAAFAFKFWGPTHEGTLVILLQTKAYFTYREMILPDARSDRDVIATLSFITPTSKFNRRYVAPGEEINTGVYEDKKVIIKDGRPSQNEFTLNTTGFALINHPSQIKNLHDKTELNEKYIPEIEGLVKELTGADKVIAFGPTLRQTKPTPGSDYQPPGTDVHIDYTSLRSHSLAQNLIANSPDPNYQYTHFKCINLWRAISTPPQDWPLAVCDAQSVDPKEGTPNLMIRCEKLPDVNSLGPIEDEDKLPAAFLFEYRDGHRRYYFSDMKKDELLVFKLFDSLKETERCPHAAFFDEGREGAVPRESLEIRTVAYFK